LAEYLTTSERETATSIEQAVQKSISRQVNFRLNSLHPIDQRAGQH